MNFETRARLAGLLLAAAFLLLPGVFIFMHSTAPSDGARLEPGTPAVRADGLVVTPLAPSSPLAPDDRVIAVNGVPVKVWADRIFDLTAPRPAWRAGQVVTYTVVRRGKQLDVPVPLGPFPLGGVLARNWSVFLFIFFCEVVASFVFWQKPGERGPQAFFLWAWSLAHAYGWIFGLQIGDWIGGWGFWVFQALAVVNWLIFNSASLYFALVFPVTHPFLVHRPWLVWVVFTAPLLFFALYLAVIRLLSSSTLDWVSRWLPGEWFFSCIIVALAGAAIVRGYRIARAPSVRRQVRWLVFGFFLSVGLTLVFWFVPGLVFSRPLVDLNFFGLTVVPFPIIVAIAILRDQLFDIDIILRRTLVYGLLTATLAVLYGVSVVVLQQLLRFVTGQGSDLAIILSTLAIAAAFNPLRRRFQRGINRRFFRSEYDARQILTAFGETVRDEVELDRLTARLLSTVEETMQPSHLSLWLRQPDDRAGPQK